MKPRVPAKGNLHLVALVIGAVSLLAVAGCKKADIVDEAKAAGLTTADLPQITADVFKPMDGGIELSPEEIMGRNTWNLWSGGNQHFWNQAAQDSYGLMDLLKMLDNRKYPRGERFKTLGVVNEPGFRAASKPDEFGLWLDEQVEPEPAGIDEKVYGKPSGVLGFRLFPNPEFNDEARKKWDGNRFMTDPTYYNDNKLVRPYRVGVACGACHISRIRTIHRPIRKIRAGKISRPPLAINTSTKAKCLPATWRRAASSTKCSTRNRAARPTLRASRPITSIIQTRSIRSSFSPNANASRCRRKWRAALSRLPGEKEEMPVAHILKDGADSIGVPGATIRVYVNIGMFSEYWLTRHNRLIGLTPQKPFEIPYAREHSVFWRATEERLGNIAAFFRKLKPFHLADAPGGAAFITTDQAVMTRGKEVFADSCAACHSSKMPPANIDPQSGEGKAWFRAAVMKPDFLEDNFLSNERRYPLTKIETNSARALGTNAKAWSRLGQFFLANLQGDFAGRRTANFSIHSTKTHPIKFRPKDKNTGPGYYRDAVTR